MSCTGASVSGAITATSGSITGTLTMGASGKIEFTGGGYLSPRYLTSGSGTLQVTGQGIRVGETNGGEIFVNAQSGGVNIYSRDGEPIALSASGGALGADITLTATDDISLTATGDISLSASGSITAGGNGIVTEGGAVNTPATITSDTIITLYIDGTAYEINAEAV